jgi:glycosyltransferase involved in cell wall biosynthesis
MGPNVSVVVPNFNYGQYLSACIETVLAQTYSDFELLIMDDGSKDNSVEIARKFTDPRVKVTTHPNAGVSATRNRGVRASTGRWIAFLDADDMWTPDSLRLRVEAAERAYNQSLHDSDTRPILVCGQSLRVARFTEVSDIPKLYQLPPDGRRFNMSTILTERKLFDRFGWFREDIRYREDKELWYRLFGKEYFKSIPRDPSLLDLSKVNVVWITDLCAFYRKHRRSATHTFRRFPRRVKAITNSLVNGEGE